MLHDMTLCVQNFQNRKKFEKQHINNIFTLFCTTEWVTLYSIMIAKRALFGDNGLKLGDNVYISLK